MKDKNLEKGFTLIEVLASLILILTVGSIIGSIVFSSTKGAGKTTALANVRQNGDFALAQMVKTVRNASGVVNPCATPTPTATSITVVNSDTSTTTFSCSSGVIYSSTALPNVTPAPVALIDGNTVTASSCNFSCSAGGVNNYPSIGISFQLSQKTASNFFEQQAVVNFQSTVVLRNQVR